MIVNIDQFLSLRHDLPVIDVRSQGEYAEGHVRGAMNIPLLNDEERAAVGIDYKQKGQQEAIRTGFRLVGPRLHDMVSAVEQVGRELLVHCWRGGMRSANFCHFVGMAKVKTLQLEGGYKAYRQLALSSFGKPFKLLVIGGCSGSGKSEIIRKLKKKGEQVLDLEGLANHKGSAFGGLMMGEQPTTEQFQNDLFEEILKLDLSRRIWIEDESIAIGKIFLPEPLWRQMVAGPLIEIGAERNIRVKRLAEEYGKADAGSFLSAMSCITKKLGGQNFAMAKEQYLQGNMIATVDILLNYYDKAYRAGLEKKKDRIKLQLSWNGVDSDSCATHLIDAGDQLIKENSQVR